MLNPEAMVLQLQKFQNFLVFICHLQLKQSGNPFDYGNSAPGLGSVSWWTSKSYIARFKWYLDWPWWSQSRLKSTTFKVTIALWYKTISQETSTLSLSKYCDIKKDPWWSTHSYRTDRFIQRSSFTNSMITLNMHLSYQVPFHIIPKLLISSPGNKPLVLALVPFNSFLLTLRSALCKMKMALPFQHGPKMKFLA